MKKLGLSIAAFGVLAAFSSAQTFHLIDLGTLGGSTSTPVGINASGQVVGRSTTTSGATHAFLYSGGVMQDLGTFGGTSSAARGINDSGTVVGLADLADGHSHAFSYSGGSMSDLGTITGNISEAHAISNTGQIVGTSSTSTTNVFHAATFKPGPVTDLGTLPGGLFAYADGVNDSGVIVGSSNNASQVELGFVYQGGVMTQLSLAGTFQTNALDINNAGQITGFSYVTGTIGHGWVRSASGTMTDLGALPGMFSSNLDAINDSGAMVGRSGSTLSSADNHGVLVTSGVMKDLNSLVDSSGSGWTITSALAINNGGAIAALATNSAGASRAVLLNPVPEPGSLAVLGLGLVAFGCGRKRVVGKRS